MLPFLVQFVSFQFNLLTSTIKTTNVDHYITTNTKETYQLVNAISTHPKLLMGRPENGCQGCVVSAQNVSNTGLAILHRTKNILVYCMLILCSSLLYHPLFCFAIQL